MSAERGGVLGGYPADHPQQHRQVLPPPPPPGMALPGFGSLAAATGAAAAAAAGHTSSAAEDPGKKIRKPYTITKSRESWTEQEHDKFLEALQLFDRDWKKIEAFVGSKTVIQIRSHAQKYFLKAQKNGMSTHVPPPRPKRKAAHPYPQKASKNGYPLKGASSSVMGNSATEAIVPSWSHNSVPPATISNVTKDDAVLERSVVNRSCCHDTESPFGSDHCDHGNHRTSLCVMPDFAQVYSFIGSVFDPNTSGHLQKLKEMNPIDVETVVLLMRNLSVNLANSDFEDHRRLLSSCDISTNERVSCAAKDALEGNKAINAPFMVKSES